MSVITEELRQSWTQVSPLLEIRSEHDYDAAIDRLNVLIDEVGADEGHPLYSLLDTMGTVIHAWEERHHPIPTVRGADLLRFLMDEHDLTSSDLLEVGAPNAVTDILKDARELDAGQIRALAERFGVSPSTFL